MGKKIAILLVVLLVIGGAVFWLMRDSDTSTETANETTKDSTSQTDEKKAADDLASGTQLAAFTKENVADHATKTDCWTIISGKVYDITEYVPRHPGGDEILQACGKDGSSLFTERKTEEGKTVGSGRPHSSSASSMLEQYLKGDLSSGTTAEPVDPATAAAQ